METFCLLTLFTSMSKAANLAQGPDKDHTEKLVRNRRWGGWLGRMGFGRQSTGKPRTACSSCQTEQNL